MTETPGWRPAPPAPAPGLADDDVLCRAVVAAYRDMEVADHGLDPGGLGNPRLGVQIRAFRRRGMWRLFLLLTPWMLARFLFPDRDPRPEGADAAPWPVPVGGLLGPRVAVTVHGSPQEAHLNDHPALGSHLVQPLVMAMDLFDRPEAVFAAWSAVVRTRDAKMRRMAGDCRWQAEISRWELLAPMRRTAAPPARNPASVA